MPWHFDPNHSQVEWACRYLGISTIKGSFDKVTAQVNVEDPDPSTWSIVVDIDPRSVTSAGFARRLEALQGEHFLDPDKFPELRFSSSRCERNAAELRVTGDLTLHGITHPIVITGRDNGEAVDARGETRRGFSGSTRIRRSDFGIPGTPQFVADDIDIAIEVQLIRQ